MKPVTIENPEDRAKFLKDVDFDSPQAIEWDLLEVDRVHPARNQQTEGQQALQHARLRHVQPEKVVLYSCKTRDLQEDHARRVHHPRRKTPPAHGTDPQAHQLLHLLGHRTGPAPLTQDFQKPRNQHAARRGRREVPEVRESQSREIRRTSIV